MDDEVALVYSARADKRERRSTTPKFYLGFAGQSENSCNVSSPQCHARLP